MESQLIDPKLFRTFFASFLASILGYYVLYLVYMLLENYMDIFILSVLSSLAIKPLKDYALSSIKHHLENPYSFSCTSNSFCSAALKFFLDFKNYKFSLKSYYLPLMLVMYLIVFKIQLKFQPIIIGVFCLMDLFFRFLADLALLINNKKLINENSEVLVSIVTIGTILGVILGVFVIHSLAFGCMILEISQESQTLYYQLSKLTGSELVQQLIDQVNERLGQDELVDITNSLLEDVPMGEDLECSYILDTLVDTPYIGPLAKSYRGLVDEWLAYAGISSAQIIEVYTFYSDRINNAVLKAAMFLSNQLYLNIFSLTMSISSTFEKAIIFVTLLYLLLREEKTFVSKLFDAIPFPENIEEEISNTFTASVVGLFSAISKCAVSHFIITWVIYDLLDLSLKYTFAAFSAGIALFPVFPAWVINIPTIVYLCIGGEYVKACILLSVEWFLQDYIDSSFYEKDVREVNPDLVAIAIGLGLYEFGSLGIIYGPLIACAGVLLYKIGSKWV